MRQIALTIIIACFTFSALSQTERQKLSAVRTTSSLKIDGEINEEAWKAAAHIGRLVEQRPTFGKPEDASTHSDVYVLYDDEAVYFGGMLYETNRDSILTELAGRDAIGVNDFIGIIFDTYQDRINGLGFYVTPLGEQFDIKYGIGNEDISWNTVYQSESKIHNNGWSFEMKIPYSAIRFSKEKIQNWGMQVVRRRNKTGQQFTWNPVNPANFGFMNQAGDLEGLSDIKPPVRLSFSPYFSTYYSHNPAVVGKKSSVSVNGGMDVKYGISDGFTMDMTLIPDFGQVQSDNQILNLTPFEVRYNEYRTFFNEGTELFNKGNLFYSRRVGGQPIHFNDVYNMIGAGETVVKNPLETKLINATKVSGRTKEKLGIGFFNAVTQAQYATIENSAKQQYKIQTSPLTNYNILVLDQAMKNNSSVALVNTNVWRSGSDYDANVTAVLWDLYDKKVDWNVWGNLTHSRQVGYEAPGKTRSGYTYNVFGGKFKGRFNFEVHRFFADRNYDPSDMGYFTNNNYVDHGFWAGYKWLKPKSFYNNLYLNVSATYSTMYKPDHYQYARINANINGQMKNLWQVGFNGDWRPEAQDFYEPRVAGKKIKIPGSYMTGVWFNSNRSKRYTISGEFYRRRAAKYDSYGIETGMGHNYRFSDKLSIGLSTGVDIFENNLGFAYRAGGDSVIVGLRKRNTVDNVFNVKYNFNNKMGLTFRLRHYWSKVDYSEDKLFHLKDDGHLEIPAGITRNPDNNVNFFNIDMNYTWQFAPGSFMNVNWKTSSDLFNKMVDDSYFRNLKNTLDNPQLSNFSVKVIYFLDYLSLRGKPKKLPKS